MGRGGRDLQLLDVGGQGQGGYGSGQREKILTMTIARYLLIYQQGVDHQIKKIYIQISKEIFLFKRIIAKGRGSIVMGTNPATTGAESVFWSAKQDFFSRGQ